MRSCARSSAFWQSSRNPGRFFTWPMRKWSDIGCSSGEIAHRLQIAESTVNEHVVRMMQKTETVNRVELIATTMGSREF